KAIHVLARKNASKSGRQDFCLYRTTAATIIRGISNKKLRNSFNILSQSAPPAIIGHQPKAQNGISNKSHQGTRSREVSRRRRCANAQTNNSQRRISDGWMTRFFVISTVR